MSDNRSKNQRTMGGVDDEKDWVTTKQVQAAVSTALNSGRDEAYKDAAVMALAKIATELQIIRWIMDEEMQ